MNFTEAVSSCFKKYTTFAGRSARSEFWYWVLFTVLVSMGCGILDGALFPSTDPMRSTGPIGALFSLATLVPGLAVTARRLHDIGRSGWWMLIALTGIGILLLLYWYCQKGTDGDNQYGADPLRS